MATVPTQEESARKIIQILAVDHRPGTGMMLNALRSRFGETRTDDLAAGLRFAEEQGWITISQDGRQFIIITETGFSEA